MKSQITQVLERTFHGMNVKLDEPSSEWIHGTVIWEGFDDKDMGERQGLVRKALKEALGAQFREVGILLTYTPHEMAAMRAA